MTSEFVPKFKTPWEGKEKPRTERTIGLRVHPEEVKRVDAFRSAFMDGSRIRTLIEEALAKGKEGKPEGISDREYFDVLGRMLGEREVLDLGIVRRIASMPSSVEGDAFRVALERRERNSDPYPLEEFNGDLIGDGTENVPGEKEEQVVLVIRRHIQQAQMESKILRAGQGLVSDFEDKLADAEPGLVNLLYYGQDSVDRMLGTSLAMKNFRMASTSVREWVMDMAGQIQTLKPEHRLYALMAFTEDLKKALHDCADMDGAKVARMISGISFTYTYHGVHFL